MKGTMGFVKDFKAGTELAPTFGTHAGELMAGFYNHTYAMLAIHKDKVELLCIHTKPEWRGNGSARRTVGLLVMLAIKHHVSIEVRRYHPFDNSPMDAVLLARWFFRRGLRVVGMGQLRCPSNAGVSVQPVA